ncbi:MAG: class I SAM-dependent methyltransferase [Alphaproteobacteria bacterium]
MARTLTHGEARVFYDRIGARNDWLAFQEDAARAELIAHGEFGRATVVIEFGCGTGRLAATLLADRLPRHCNYLGIDMSETMVRLARTRLAPWADRARVEQTTGAIEVPAADGACDRFVSTYVLDLLSEADIRALLAEARRKLAPEGLLCLVSLTRGATRPSAAVMRVWTALHALRPSLVGGCRPIEIGAYLDEGAWRIVHHRVRTTFAVSSEIAVAARRA